MRIGSTLAAGHAAMGEVRGLGPMLALELAEQSPDQARRSSEPLSSVAAAAACGLYGNVIRLLAPLTIEPDELDEGLARLGEALDAAL